MGGDGHTVDIPCDLLCRILQYCCDGNVYNLDLFSTVSKSFRAAVLTVCHASSLLAGGIAHLSSVGLMGAAMQICSSLEIADMRYFHATGPTSDVQWRTTAMVNVSRKP